MKYFLHLKTAAVMLLACLTLSTFAQEKAKIKIRKNVNGEVEVIEQDIEITSGDDLEEILKELNILDEFGNLTEGQAFEISVKKLDKSNQVQAYDLSYFPEPENQKKAFLGVRLKNSIDEGVETPGAYVSAIIPESAASKSDLQAGDVIVKMDKTEISNYKELVSAILSHAPGDKVKIVYIRDGKTEKTKIELGENAQNEERWLINHSNLPSPACANPEAWAFNDRVEFSQKAFLGVTPGEAVEKGVRIGSVIPGSSADEAGLEADDVLLKYAGSEVNNFKELSTIIGASTIGQEVEIVVLRDSKEKVLQATLGARNQGNVNGLHFFEEYEGIDEDGTHLFELEIESEKMEEGLAELFEELAELENGLEQMENELGELNPESEQFMRELADLGNQLEAELGLIQERPDGYEVSSEINVSISLDEITPEEAAAINKEAQEKLRLDNNLEMERISFYPNPSQGQFVLSFDLPSSEPVQILIFNGKGETVYNEQLVNFTGSYKNTVDLGQFANGAYFMQIIQGDKSYSKKLIKGE